MFKDSVKCTTAPLGVPSSIIAFAISAFTYAFAIGMLAIGSISEWKLSPLSEADHIFPRSSVAVGVHDGAGGRSLSSLISGSVTGIGQVGPDRRKILISESPEVSQGSTIAVFNACPVANAST